MDFFKYACTQDINVRCFVTRDNTYLGDGIFSHGHIYDLSKNNLVEYKEQIESDIIYDKGSLIASTKDKGNIINHPRFNLLCKDKVRSAHIFPDLFPESIKVQNEDDLSMAIDLLGSEKVVVKPLTGQEGRDINIVKKENISDIRDMTDKDELVVQEYIETGTGIKDLTDKRHDLRVLIMNGEIVQAYIRTPAKGKLIANVSQGGKLEEIEITDLPDDILDAVKRVELKFSKYYPRIYSIDFGYTEKGPKIFEFNSQPGLPFPSWGKYYHIWHEKLFETLISSIK